MQITRLQIDGLFGYLAHDVHFRVDAPTILTGPNGSGKTHTLKILQALVSLQFDSLREHPFGSAELTLSDGRRLRATRHPTDSDEPVVRVEGFSRADRSVGAHVISGTPSELDRRALPPWVERVGPEEWFDQESQEWLSTREVIRRYQRGQQVATLLADEPWLQEFAPAEPPTFIETGRLDLAPRTRDSRRGSPRGRPAPNRSAIELYVERIKAQVSEARRTSLTVSQQADREFAARALDKARQTVNAGDLRRRYEAITALHHELHENGLTDEAVSVEFPAARPNPTERRILNVFLEDWERKLEPLIPVHRKLQTLRGIVESKIAEKAMNIASSGDITFDSPGGQPLAPAQLSSGEQHMLALFTMLLFAARPGSLVLIDEPEISLHAAWKHEFLEDIERVSQSIPVTVVLATHSTALINGRWELVEELGIRRDEA